MRKKDVPPFATAHAAPEGTEPGEMEDTEKHEPRGPVVETGRRNAVPGAAARRNGRVAKGTSFRLQDGWSEDLACGRRHCPPVEICPEENRSVLTHAQRMSV